MIYFYGLTLGSSTLCLSFISDHLALFLRCGAILMKCVRTEWQIPL